MIARKYQELTTWQLTEELKEEVFRLIRASPNADRNFTYRDQIFDSAGAPSKHVAEGFLRFSPKEFCRFLDFAVSSVGETENHLRDGVTLGYFTIEDCSPALRLATRCCKAILSLKQSQKRYIQAQQEARQRAKSVRRR